MNNTIKQIFVTAQAIQKDVNLIAPPESSSINLEIKSDLPKNDKLYLALKEKSESLANSYAQVKIDIESDNRFSWAGTAHEIREILATLLRLLAPDNVVTTQSWYKTDSNTSGATQKQRVIYILKSRNSGTNEKDVLEQITGIEDMIGNLVRSTYSRASDAAHRFKERQEVRKILRYFDAFAYDLLNL